MADTITDKQIKPIAGPALADIDNGIRELGIYTYLTDRQIDRMIEGIEVHLYALAKAAIQAERARAEAAERERDAYAAALQRIADETPGMHEDHEGLLGACETCCGLINDAAMTLGIEPVEAEQDPGDYEPF